MIINFKFESGFIFIEAEKEGIAKAYEISNSKFKSYNITKTSYYDTESDGYSLDDEKISSLKHNSALVIPLLEELETLEDLSLISSILGIYLRNDSVKNVYDYIYANNKGILYNDIQEGDYISYVDDETKDLLVCKITKNRNEEDEEDTVYKLFDVMSDTFDDEYFSSIEELVSRYDKEYKFNILKVGGYDCMIPAQTEWYSIYDDSYEEYMCSAYLSVENGKYSMRCEFTDEIYGDHPSPDMDELVTDTYDELIFNLLKQYKLVLPLRECMKSI